MKRNGELCSGSVGIDVIGNIGIDALGDGADNGDIAVFNGIDYDLGMALGYFTDKAMLIIKLFGEKQLAVKPAEADGFATFTTIYGQTQELSAAWFADLDVHANAAEEAAAVYTNPAFVIWGSDDEAVNPAISEAVATALNAITLDATGEGHGYGFYSETEEVRELVSLCTADFFAEKLQ